MRAVLQYSVSQASGEFQLDANSPLPTVAYVSLGERGVRTFGDNFGNKSGVFQLLTRRIPKSDIKTTQIDGFVLATKSVNRHHKVMRCNQV